MINRSSAVALLQDLLKARKKKFYYLSETKGDILMKPVLKIIALAAIFIMSSCASPQVKNTPIYSKIGEIVLSKGIDRTEIAAVPVDITTKFSSNDINIFALVAFDSLTGSHEFKFDWYDPKGELFTSSDLTPLHTKEGKMRKSVTLWHRLNVKDDRAQNYKGSWQVVLHMDGKVINKKDFTIE